MITFIELIIFCLLSVSVAYVGVFAIASRYGGEKLMADQSLRPSFLIIFPAYAEDQVIVNSVQSVLRQQPSPYSATVCVVSDHMSEATNAVLAQLPIKLIQATYTDSTKGKALQTAMRQVYNPAFHSHVVILDADNVVETDFLIRLAPLCTPQTIALQLHRCAKNTGTAVAMLDAVSEEINNSIFRLGHNRLGLSSALIGSGMCFRADWLASVVDELQTAGEDKELERLLMGAGIHITYVPTIPVYDEKVSNRSNFGKQRRRWLAAQLWSLKEMLPFVPQALRLHRIDYLDKTLQQALIPRSLLLALTIVATSITTIVSFICPDFDGACKWWALLLTLIVALLLAIPNYLYTFRLLRALAILPAMVMQMLLSLFNARGATHTFIHTEHGTHTS